MVAQHLLTQSDREHLGGEVSTSVVKGPICSPAITSSNVSDVSNIPSLLNIWYIVRAPKSQTFDLHSIRILAALGVSISENHLLSNSLFSPSQAEISWISWVSQLSHILISRISEILRYIFNNSTTQCEHLGEVSAICCQSLPALPALPSQALPSRSHLPTLQLSQADKQTAGVWIWKSHWGKLTTDNR